MANRASPWRAIFDLAHLATLSDVPGLALFVSPRTLYCLQNLVLQDVADTSRYATSILDDVWYIPVKAGDPECQTARDVIEGAQAEVYAMPFYGYVDVYTKRMSGSPVEAGTYIVTYMVPEDELWEVQVLSAINLNRAQPMKIDVTESTGATSVLLKQETPVAVGDWVTWQGKLVLKGLMRFRFVFYGTQIDDTCYTEIHVTKLVPL